MGIFSTDNQGVIKGLFADRLKLVDNVNRKSKLPLPRADWQCGQLWGVLSELCQWG